MARYSKRVKIFLRRLQRFFVTTVIGGIVVILPITIFVWLVRLIFRLILNIIQPVSKLFHFHSDVKTWLVYLISFGIMVGLFFVIGLMVRTELGKRLFHFLESNYLSQLPFYTILRDTVQQFAGQKQMPFSQVVLVDVFGNDTLMTGFITDEMDDDRFTVFVPTAPNPTNGFVFHVKRHQIRFLDARTEEAMRSIISIGVGSKVLFQAPELKKK